MPAELGWDHAERMALDPNNPSPSSDSSSRSPSSTGTKQVNGFPKRKEDAIESAPKDNDANNPELKLSTTHTHTLGKIVLRAAEDDLPVDWWFASTAIPLIAATFAPMANLLSIAALVVPWRNSVTNEEPALRESTSVGYADPRWCFALNIASLVCGFVGNLFLLFNFTRRLRYIVALPATIILFYVASGILIGITVSMNEHVPPRQNEVYSQGFWHAIIAATLYMFNSMILMVNMLGYFLGHYPQHFDLTYEQRNLILQTIMFFIWLGGGAAVFSYREQWTYPDALYFCDVTILTIGFGDLVATNDLDRGLVFPFSVGGTIILGLMVSSIHRFAQELSQDKVLRQHVEKRRVDTLSRAITLTNEEKNREELERAAQNGQRLNISNPIVDPKIQQNLDAAGAASKEKRIDIVEPTKPDSNTAQDSEPEAHQFLNSAWARTTLRAVTAPVVVPVHTVSKFMSNTQKALIMREEKDRFDAMRKIQYNASQFKKWYALCISVIAFGILWCIGAVVFWKAEENTQGLNYFESLYFCYVSLLTIGYGDLSPRSNAGKPFFVLWSLVAVPTMTILISDMSDTVIAAFKNFTFWVADFTVLPKAGIWRNILESNHWLLDWVARKAEEHRLEKGLPVGPDPNQVDDPTDPSIDQAEVPSLSEGQLTKKLALAIRDTALDVSRAPDKKYDYDEWVKFTRLIRFTKMDIRELKEDEDQEGPVEWDWLDENSPMLSEKSEPEWVLNRLCESLLRLLKKKNIGTESGDQPSISLNPPILDSTNNRRRYSVSSDAISANSMATDTAPRIWGVNQADAFINFFTGERHGTDAYASSQPMWSKKALERRRIPGRKASI
ncbi:hypothetical protein DV736_g1149, partial [Chaetothyriales sp. CBS 134916]